MVRTPDEQREYQTARDREIQRFNSETGGVWGDYVTAADDDETEST